MALAAVLAAVLGAIAGCATSGTVADGTQGGDGMAEDGRFTYGRGEWQFGDLTTPDSGGPHPVVVLIHGGFWRARYGSDLMVPLAEDLTARGFAVWNLEYRRVGQSGGGYPGTLDDIADGIDQLVELAAPHRLDLDRVAVVGHSAGGHLALWAAGRVDLPASAPGAAPAVRPRFAVGQAPVVDLVGGAEAGLGAGAVVDFMGGPPGALVDEYAIATPRPGPAALVVSGTEDEIVPVSFSAMPGAVVVEVEGADHFDVIDPTHESWLIVATELEAAIG